LSKMTIFIALGLATLVGAVYVACYIYKGKEVKESKVWTPQRPTLRWEIVPRRHLVEKFKRTRGNVLSLSSPDRQKSACQNGE